jgi:hypothetical protein
MMCNELTSIGKSLLWTSIAQGIAMFIIGFYVRFFPPVKGADIPPFGYVALTCIFLFAAFFQFGWGPVCWILVSEIPTARLRAMNVAIAAATQWLFNFVVAQAVPHMLATVGRAGYGTYFIFGSFCFSMFIFTWFLIPETKGLSLERYVPIIPLTTTSKLTKQIRMDSLFGTPSDTKLADEESVHAAPTTIHETTASAPIGPEKSASEPIHVERK